MSVSDPQLRIAQLERELHWAQLKIQVLEERLRKQRIHFLGPHSETLNNLQLELLAEEEPSVTADEVEAEAKREPIARKPRKERKSHPGREPLPAHLPRVEKVVRCEEKTCRACGEETAVIGYDESERLDIEPARYFVQVIKREKRACRCCQQGTVTMAPLEERIVEKGLASDAVVIDTVVSKYCDHLPLYRQAAILEREAGLEIGRATLDGWVMRVGEMLIPVVEAMRRDLLDAEYLQADETTVPVQMHDRRGKNHEAYLWQYGKPGGETVFDFCPTRGRERSETLFGRLGRYFTNGRLSGLRGDRRTEDGARGVLGARAPEVRGRGESESARCRSDQDGDADGRTLSGGPRPASKGAGFGSAVVTAAGVGAAVGG